MNPTINSGMIYPRGGSPTSALSTGIASAPPVAEIPRLVQELRKRAEEAAQVAKDLGNRLAPISRCIPTASVGGARVKPSTELGGELESVISAIDTLLGVLSEINQTLEL
jgi:hypothetical protein